MTQDLMQIVSASYLCSPEISKCLAEGIQAYDADDYLKAISVLIPQIESMLRELLTVLELPIRKRVRRRPGFSELKNMNDVLSDPRVENAMEEDLLFLLRIVFTDPRGWNLRNEFAHGALPPDAFNQGTASVVMMSVLLLAVIGPNSFYLPSEALEDAQEFPIATEASQDDPSVTPVEA